MNKRIKKKRWLEIKLAECLAREHVIMSAVTEQNRQIIKQANEISELRSADTPGIPFLFSSYNNSSNKLGQSTFIRFRILEIALCMSGAVHDQLFRALRAVPVNLLTHGTRNENIR